MYVGISLPSGPGPSENIEAPEERINIKAVKHRRNEVARYLCSNNIQMVRHFGTISGRVLGLLVIYRLVL
jgi:hypothetical protein